MTLRQRKVMRGKITLSVRKASYPVGLIILPWNTNLHAQDTSQMQAIIDQTQRCTEVCDASGQESHAEHGGFSASCFRLAIASAQQCFSAGRQALNAPDARWCISVVLVPARPILGPMFGFSEVQPLNGYYFQFLNSSPRNVLVDIDDCKQDPDMQAQCKLLTVQVGDHKTYAGYNYRRPPNPRNFRGSPPDR
jgi:hypothetical protein